jgi:micrococcal nuclease
VAVFSVAAYLSGEPAKEKLLNSVEISDNFISNHETLAFYAMLMTIPPNVKFADEFLKLQKEARENNRGLWKE